MTGDRGLINVGRVELPLPHFLGQQPRGPRDLGPADIDEAAIARHLWTAAWPDPDLLIRTSGEMRISNFLLWQLAYAEIHVTPVLWPDFTRGDLYEAIIEYQRRERRFGKVTV